MGFTALEVRRLNFKVQAGNVIDADAGTAWYQSWLGNNPALTSERVLDQYATIKANVPTGSQVTQRATIAGYTTGVLNGIVSNEYNDGACISHRLTQVQPGFPNTWISYNTYNDAASGKKDLWVAPVSVPQTNGSPSQGYEIELWSGDPCDVEKGTAVLIPFTLDASLPTGEVGWVWNYDQGLLFLSNQTKVFIDTNSGVGGIFPEGLDFYIKGYRYIGTTGGGGGGAQGAQGAQGATGSGAQGNQGNTGNQGFQGNTGTGAQGNQGNTGNTGSQGNQGNQGFQGNTGTGAQGNQGNTGNTGSQGNQGFQGDTGAQGAQGFQGDIGAQGNQGNQGSIGNQGFQGDTGNQGNQGFQGDTGAQGNQGKKGKQGNQGNQGFQGDTGSQGDQG